MSKIKPLLFVIAFISFSFSSKSQVNVDSLNLQLRQLFSTITPPTSGYLYDMSVHIVDSIFFQPNCSFATNTNNWFFQYDEMRNMAFDTTTWLRADTVFARADRKVQTDTIPMGFMDFKFHYFTAGALDTNIYFNFDTVNTILTDVTGAPSPYVANRLYTSSPLFDRSMLLDVVFTFDPQFFFNDAASISDFTNGAILKIDFGDGSGWHTVNYFGGLQAFNITYPSAGAYSISTQVYIPGRTRTSYADFSVGGVATEAHTEITDVDGLDVNVYSNGCTPNPYDKVVIYLEGIDPLNQRNADVVYDQMIKQEQVAQLRNLGYSFVVVSWKHSSDDIMDNGMRIVELINHLKCQSTDPQPYVVIGESMGGLIARYALLYMESSDYLSATYDVCVKQRLMHNTRLFISLDVPHQGANIPLGIQHFYRDALNVFCMNNFLGKARLASHNLFLDSKAAKQMLIYHESTRSTGGAYTYHSLRDDLITVFTDLGNYPKYCKNVTMPNGSLGGVAQSNLFGNARTPNDLLLGITGKIEVKIFGKKHKIFENDITIRTNPDGNGTVYSSTAGTLNYKLKLKFWGVKVVQTYTNLHNNVKSVVDILPYCVSAGGWYGDNYLQGNLPQSGAFLLGEAFGLVDVSPGNYTFEVKAGIPWLAQGGASISATSDGMIFGFIPTKSAIDFIANPDSLDENLLPTTSAELDYLLDNQAFSLVIGNNRSDNNTFNTFRNRDHLHFRNEIIDTFACSDPEIGSYVVNREIGDDTIRIDNMVLNRNARYQAEVDTRVNTFDHWMYNYQGATPAKNEKIYSRSNPFEYETANPGSYIATFESGTNFDINSVNGTYQTNNISLTNCCTNYANRAAPKLEELQVESFMELYPNPAFHSITLHYKFKEKGSTTIKIFDMLGNLIYKQKLLLSNSQSDTYTPITLNENSFSNGVYLIQIDNGKEKLFSKFVKQ